MCRIGMRDSLLGGEGIRLILLQDVLGRLRLELRHPLRDVYRWIVGNLSTLLRDVSRLEESLGLDVPELVVYRATGMDRLLAVRHTRSVIREAPSENGKSDTRKPMRLPVGIHDEPQGDV